MKLTEKSNKPTIDGVYTYRDFESGLQFLTRDLVIYTQVFNEELGLRPDQWACWIVHRGSSTDGASIPKFVRPILWVAPEDEEIFLAAIGHDDLYKNQEITFFIFDKENREIGEKIKTIKITRTQADTFIKDKMYHLGANIYDRNMVREGLRIGGWKAWNNYKEFNQKNYVKTKNSMGSDQELL